MSKETIEVFSPAKINLFLGIIGKRKDKFHELLSLVAQLNFGDSLKIALTEGKDKIICDYPGLPTGNDNIILKAIKAFRGRYAFQNGVNVFLDKKIPIGAGLGGGSSNAVAVLKGLNQLLGNALHQDDLKEIASELGSDCMLFFEDCPVFMRGRGDLIDPVDSAFKERLRGQRVLIFKPDFSIDTTWAYQQIALNPRFYIEREDAEFVLKESIDKFLMCGDLGDIMYNNFEKVIFEKHEVLHQLIKTLKMEFNLKCLLSGSGSACFCALEEQCDLIDIVTMIKEVLGKDIFIVETTIC